MEFDRFSCHKNQPKTEENVTSYAFGGRVMEDIPCLPIKSVASKFEGIVQKWKWKTKEGSSTPYKLIFINLQLSRITNISSTPQMVLSFEQSE